LTADTNYLALKSNCPFFFLPTMTQQHDDDLLPENTSGYKLSQPKLGLAEYQKMGE